MKKIKKSLAVLLAIVMLASFTPLFASAAPTILNSSNCVVVEVPKLSVAGGTPSDNVTVDYGAKYGDITVTGGKITYNGEEIAGTFAWYNNNATPGVGTNSAPIYFKPTNTKRFSQGLFQSTDANPIEGWPTITVKGAYTEIKTAPTTATATVGTRLRSISLTGSVVDENGNDLGGTWRITSSPLGGSYIYNSGVYQAQWSKTGYEYQYADVYVTVTDEAYKVEARPSFADTKYRENMTHKDLNITPGKMTDLKTGAEIAGTYSAATPDTSITKVATVIGGIVFTPADTTLPAITISSVTGKVVKGDITFADSFEKLIITHGNPNRSITVANYTASDITTVPEGAIESIWWDLNEFNAATISPEYVGKTVDVKVTLYPTSAVSDKYEATELVVPFEIAPRNVTGNFAHNFGYTWENQNEGKIIIRYHADQTGYFGTVTIKLNDEVVGEVKPSDAELGGEYNFTTTITKAVDGEYVLSATYNPDPRDVGTVENPVQLFNNGKPIIVDVRMSVKTFVYQPDGRSDKATALEDEIGYIEMQAPDYKSEEVEYWEVKDKNGNPVTLYDEEGNPVDYNQTTFRYVVPGIEELHFYPHGVWDDAIIANPDDGIGGILWAFWQRFVNFIVEIYRTIMDFFVPAVEQY